MKKIVSIIILISMVFLVSSCSFSDKENIIKYDLLNEPKNLDPQTATDNASLMVINSVFEGLFYINEFGEVKNSLAKSINKSNDGLTYTIEIIDEALWENGDNVTANDFVFALQRLISKDTNSAGASQFFCIKNAKQVNTGEMDKLKLGVIAVTDKKLQIELEYENENFKNLLATTYAMPCNQEFFYETKGKYGLQAKHTMTNGAFNIYSWSHGKNIRIRKNDNYYDKKNVTCDGVNFYIPNEETTLERLMEKDINASFIDGNDINKFINKGYNTEPIEDTTWGLYLNTKNKSLSDINIRKAIAKCFDRSSYSDKLKSNLSVANAIIPDSIMLNNKSYRDYAGENIVPEFDAKKAYEYYKTGLETLKKENIQSLKLLINKDEQIDAINYFSYPSQIIQKELGLFINIDEVDQNEYNKRIQAGDFDIALYKLKSSDNTVNSIFERFESNSNKNYISYKNPDYDNLILDTMSQNHKVVNRYINLEKMIIEDSVFIPMFYATNYFVLTDETRGIIYNKTTGLINFKNAIVS